MSVSPDTRAGWYEAVERLAVSPAPPQASEADWHRKQYEIFVRHFEEIWKTIAVNFSYVAAAVAVIVTFGASRFTVRTLLLTGCAAVLFWFAAVFLPFACYGMHVLAQLRSLEDQSRSPLRFFSSWLTTGAVRRWLPFVAVTIAALTAVTIGLVALFWPSRLPDITAPRDVRVTLPSAMTAGVDAPADARFQALERDLAGIKQVVLDSRREAEATIRRLEQRITELGKAVERR